VSLILQFISDTTSSRLIVDLHNILAGSGANLVWASEDPFEGAAVSGLTVTVAICERLANGMVREQPGGGGHGCFPKFILNGA